MFGLSKLCLAKFTRVFAEDRQILCYFDISSSQSTQWGAIQISSILIFLFVFWCSPILLPMLFLCQCSLEIEVVNMVYLSTNVPSKDVNIKKHINSNKFYILNDRLCFSVCALHRNYQFIRFRLIFFVLCFALQKSFKI